MDEATVDSFDQTSLAGSPGCCVAAIRGIPAVTRPSEMVAEQRVIADAVAHHDPDGAERALRHHLRMVLRELPRIRRRHPDYFEEP